MKLIYEGPHLDVEVPLDDPYGGFLTAERGQPVDVPDDVAAGLLEQGRSENPEHQHECPWRKATAKELAGADKVAGKAATDTAGEAAEGDLS
jgi:hypothetical protein